MIVQEIKKRIHMALQELKFTEVEVELEHPEDDEHGDYATNVALKLKTQRANLKSISQISKLKNFKSPRELAEKIVEELKRSDLFALRGRTSLVKNIEVAGPGFINFWLSEQFLLTELTHVFDLGESYGRNETCEGKKIMVEFTDPNPFKEFHIGHLYSNTVGEALARLLEASGAVVRRANYQGDVGLHVAKAVYGLLAKLTVKSQKLKVNEEKLKELEKKQLAERIRILGEVYAAGARVYEEEERAKKEIEGINTKIYERSDPKINELYDAGKRWSLEYFETMYRRLGTKFDFYYFESEAGRIGLEVVKGGLRKGVFEESQGAIIFPGEKHGLHTRVFVNSQGLPTYEAKDLGLAPTKYKDFPYDESIIITGNEVNEYFRVVLKALALLTPELGQKTQHLSHGMVRLPTGKMSSRTGEVLTGSWLIEEAKKRVLEIIRKTGSLEEKLWDEVAEMVGIGAVKYALLRGSIGRDIIFDIDGSVSFEGNSGPYLQYTYARARSVLRKSKVTLRLSGSSHRARGTQAFGSETQARRGDTLALGKFSERVKFKTNAEELAILRWLYRFPEVVEQAGKGYAPSQVAEYLYNLAQRFNSFYNKHSILLPQNELKTPHFAKASRGRQNSLRLLRLRSGQVRSGQATLKGRAQSFDAIKEFRLELTAAVAQILRSGLFLLGITAPEKM